MSVLAPFESAPPTLFDLAGGEPMLDEVLVGVWEGLAAHKIVDCLVCGERMVPERGLDALLSGRCKSCGTKLS